jgi:hypothetical protein
VAFSGQFLQFFLPEKYYFNTYKGDFNGTNFPDFEDFFHFEITKFLQ